MSWPTVLIRTGLGGSPMGCFFFVSMRCTLVNVFCLFACWWWCMMWRLCAIFMSSFFFFFHFCVFMCCIKPMLCSASFVCYEGISVYQLGPSLLLLFQEIEMVAFHRRRITCNAYLGRLDRLLHIFFYCWCTTCAYFFFFFYFVFVFYFFFIFSYFIICSLLLLLISFLLLHLILLFLSDSYFTKVFLYEYYFCSLTIYHH